MRMFEAGSDGPVPLSSKQAHSGRGPVLYLPVGVPPKLLLFGPERPNLRMVADQGYAREEPAFVAQDVTELDWNGSQGFGQSLHCPVGRPNLGHVGICTFVKFRIFTKTDQSRPTMLGKYLLPCRSDRNL